MQHASVRTRGGGEIIYLSAFLRFSFFEMMEFSLKMLMEGEEGGVGAANWQTSESPHEDANVEAVVRRRGGGGRRAEEEEEVTIEEMRDAN